MNDDTTVAHNEHDGRDEHVVINCLRRVRRVVVVVAVLAVARPTASRGF
jgi:hypothetical protein